MTTVIDQASPWQVPRKRFATTMSHQPGAMPIRSGTGRASNQPARAAAPPDTVGERAGREVRERLRESERDDEGEDRGLRGQLEVLLADQREDRSLEADHGADERVDPDEQRELAGVRPQAELNVAHAGSWWRRFGWPRRSPPVEAERWQIDEERLNEGALACMLERLVVTPLETDRGERVARKPAPADGAADMARVDDHAVVEPEQLFTDA